MHSAHGALNVHLVASKFISRWKSQDDDEQSTEADRSLLVRLLYKMLLPLAYSLAYVYKYWYEGTITLAIEAIAGYWCMFGSSAGLLSQSHPWDGQWVSAMGAVPLPLLHSGGGSR